MQTKELDEFKGGVLKKKEPQITQEQEQVDITPTTKEEQSKMQPPDIKPQIGLVEEEVKIVDSKVGTKPLVAIQVETT
jgi:hypothetical protein